MRQGLPTNAKSECQPLVEAPVVDEICVDRVEVNIDRILQLWLVGIGCVTKHEVCQTDTALTVTTRTKRRLGRIAACGGPVEGVASSGVYEDLLLLRSPHPCKAP